MLMHMYHARPEGKVNDGKCQYTFVSLPLIPGEYKFMVELRTINGHAYHAQPSDVRTPGDLHAKGLCRLDKEILYRQPLYKKRPLLDQPVAPGIVNFVVPEREVTAEQCNQWNSRGVWFHWTQMKLAREKCAFQCSDLEPRDDFIWCSKKFANSILFTNWMDFRKQVDLKGVSWAKGNLTTTTKIAILGSSLVKELCDFIQRKLGGNFCAATTGKAKWKTVIPGLMMTYVKAWGVMPRAWDNINCDLEINAGLKTIHQMVSEVGRLKPNVVWLEESAHSYQKVGDKEWLALIRSYFELLRKKYQGVIIWRSLTPYVLHSCCQMKGGCAWYTFADIPRVARLHEASNNIAKEFNAHIMDSFELALDRPETFKDGLHASPEIPCEIVDYNTLPRKKNGKMDHEVQDRAISNARKAKKPCAEKKCESFQKGCFHGNLNWGGQMRKLNYPAVAEYMAQGFLHETLKA